MDRDSITESLQDVFDDIFIDDVTVTDELSALDVDEWDSILQISLNLSVEKVFGIKFQTGEVEGTQNVGSFIDLIEKKLEKAS